MGVLNIIFWLLFHVAIIYGQSDVGDYEDLEGRKIENVTKYCEYKYCALKCCEESEILLVKSDTEIACSTNTFTHVQPVSQFSVYKYNKTIHEPTKTYENSSHMVFIRKTNFNFTDFFSDFIGTDFSLYENEPFLIVEDTNGTAIDQIEMNNSCLDLMYNETSEEPKIMKYAYVISKYANGNPNEPTYVESTCENLFLDSETDEVIDLKEKCKGTHCISKCCRKSSRILFVEYGEEVRCEYLSEINNRTKVNLSIDLSKIDVYKNNIDYKMETSGLTLRDFTIVRNYKTQFNGCMTPVEVITDYEYRILENGSLMVDNINYYNRFRSPPLNMEDYCFEHFVKQSDQGVEGPFLIFRLKLSENEQPSDDSAERSTEIYKVIALLISCVFIILVLIVYGVNRELRNIGGMVLMAYLTTLTITFFFKAIQSLGLVTERFNNTICKPYSVFLYYTTLSTFFWMNIMSLDIWWTFRGMFKSRRIHRHGELAKFAWYGLYSWGTPLLVTIAVAIIDYSDLRHLPHIYQPHFENCFRVKGQVMEMRHYLHMPILALLIVDLIFYLLTTFNIWRIKRCMARFANDMNKYNNNSNRFGLYLKLSLVMGISWIFEVVDLPDWIQWPALVYNSLIGVAIFFVFVFKKKILIKLCNRFNIRNKFVENLQRKPSTATTTNSHTHDPSGRDK